VAGLFVLHWAQVLQQRFRLRTDRTGVCARPSARGYVHAPTGQQAGLQQPCQFVIGRLERARLELNY
jgi:hypothetical protein